jgi:hypothetical protein
MTDDDTTKDDDDGMEDGNGVTDSGSDSGTVDRDTLKAAIREVLADLDVLKDTPGEGTVDPDAEPVTIKAVEAAARRAVEDAMKPLREAVAKKPAKKAAPKPKPEPEASPAVTVTSRWRKMMWGGDDE